MSNDISQLNLARKWRPKTFDSIVGQTVPVRMLKNSLFLKKFFPVYLFAGQRGCGKTSTARVFAAAINCQMLSQFQTDPTTPIPCLSCTSCLSMAQGNHPDFIEIDAASHTGVDNVRQIIESSSYMPLSGQKKIYLIDEAHMLSKAAFNAFLKILEEPPVSVLFILATTEIQKIPPTVLSRCFQALFTALESSSLKEHLQSICSAESVLIDDDALDILIQETEGCARDAINLLERVRFSGTHITGQGMLELLGKISNQLLFSLFDAIVHQNPSQMLSILVQNHFEQLSPTALWDSLVHLLRTLIWVHYGVQNNDPRFGTDHEILSNLTKACSINRLQALAQLLWNQEELFLKTNKKHLFLEMVLLQMCQQVNIADLEQLLSSHQTTNRSANTKQQLSDTWMPPKSLLHSEAQQLTNSSSKISTLTATPLQTPSKEVTKPTNLESEAASSPWQAFLKQLAVTVDPLLNSMLAQAKFVSHDEHEQAIVIELSNNSAFFKDKVTESKSLWLPLLQEQFPGVMHVSFTASTNAPATSRQNQSTTQPPTQNPAQKTASSPGISSFPSSKQAYEPAVNIQDSLKWPFANLLVRYFPGKIKQTKVYS